MPQTALKACPPHVRIRRVQGFAVMLRLFLFHSAPACDTVQLVDMNLWKLRFASLATRRRALSFGWQSRKSGKRAIGFHGFKAGDVIQEPGKSRLRANCYKPTTGGVRSSYIHRRGLVRLVVSYSSVYTRFTHIFRTVNDNVMYNARVLPHNS